MGYDWKEIKALGEKMFAAAGQPAPTITVVEDDEDENLNVDDMFSLSSDSMEVKSIAGTETVPCIVLTAIVHQHGTYWDPPDVDFVEVARNTSAEGIWRTIIHSNIDERINDMLEYEAVAKHMPIDAE